MPIPRSPQLALLTLMAWVTMPNGARVREKK